MNRQTYSCRQVTDFLNASNIAFKNNSARVGILNIVHGIKLPLRDNLVLSIQTHPDVAGESFAETFLQCKTEHGHQAYVDDDTGYYEDVKRFETPWKLFKHIQVVVEKFGCTDHVFTPETKADHTSPVSERSSPV